MGIFDRIVGQLGDLIDQLDEPEDVRQSVERGEELLKQGDLDGAAHELSRALLRKPDHARADVDGAASGACLGGDLPAVLLLAGHRDRATLEVDVPVLKSKDLAAAEHREDRDRRDSGQVFRNP